MSFPRSVTLKSGGQSRRERAITLSQMTTQARRLLAECSSDKCKRRCVDGIAEVRGGFYIICKCAFENYRKALQFMVEEKERRALGLPGRMGKLVDGKVELADEVGASLIDKPIKLNPPLRDSSGAEQVAVNHRAEGSNPSPAAEGAR